MHQPLDGFEGPATDIDIHAKELLRIREQLEEILARHTGQSLERIHADTERDHFIGGQPAVGLWLDRRGSRATSDGIKRWAAVVKPIDSVLDQRLTMSSSFLLQ